MTGCTVRVEHRRVEFAPRGGRCPRGGDLVRAQQAGQFQDVGSPVLLPLEWAEVLGRRADPISDGGVWGGVPPALRRVSCLTSWLPNIFSSGD